MRAGLLGPVLVLDMLLLGSGAASAAAGPPPRWSFQGPFGSFDLASAQRGYAVYAHACASCHSMRQMRFGDLAGLGLDPDEIRAVAASHSVQGGMDAEGRSVMRPARPGDDFPRPYPDEGAARLANNGAVPPDLSRLALSLPGGTRFLDAYLTGFRPTPPGVTLDPGMHYNLVVPDHSIAMPDPLQEGEVRYADGTPATVGQMAYDVSTFLSWAAHPHLVQRRQLGVRVLVYLLLLFGLVIIVKRRVWADVRS